MTQSDPQEHGGATGDLQRRFELLNRRKVSDPQSYHDANRVLYALVQDALAQLVERDARIRDDIYLIGRIGEERERLRAENEAMRAAIERLLEWDHFDSAADGAFWRKELKAALDQAQPPAVLPEAGRQEVAPKRGPGQPRKPSPMTLDESFTRQ